MVNFLYLVVPFLLVFAFFILLLFDVDLPHLVKNIHEATVWGILSLLLIKHLVDIVRKLFERQLAPVTKKSPSVNPVTTVQPAKPSIKKILTRIAFILLLMYGAFWTFVQFRQLIPLYNPFNRSINLATESPDVGSGMTNAHLILGEYEGHETSTSSSFEIWATIMVSGLDRMAIVSIDWGDGDVSKEISIMNGVNTIRHTYSFGGFKKVRLKFNTNEEVLKTVGFDGVSREEVTAEIEIQKGGSVI